MSSSTTTSACATFLHAPWKGTLFCIGPHHTSIPISQTMTGITLNHLQTIQATWEEQTLWETNPLERTPSQYLTKIFPRNNLRGRDAPREPEEVQKRTRRLQDACEQLKHKLYIRHVWLRQGASRALEGLHPLSLAEVRLDDLLAMVNTLGEYRPLRLKRNKSTIQSPRVLSQTGKTRLQVVLSPGALVRWVGADPAKTTKAVQASDNEGKISVPSEESKTSGDETKKKNQTLESPPIKPTNQPKYKGHSGTKSSMTNENLQKPEDGTHKTGKGPIKESNMSQKVSKNTSMNSNVKEGKSSAMPKNHHIAKTARERSATKREDKKPIPWVNEKEITRISDIVHSEERKDKLHRQTPTKIEKEYSKISDSNITKANKDEGHSTELGHAADSNKELSVKKSMSDTPHGDDYKTSKTVSDNTPKTRERDLAPMPTVTSSHTSTEKTVRKTHYKSSFAVPGKVDHKKVSSKSSRSSFSPHKHGRRRKHFASHRSRSSEKKSLKQRTQRDKQRTEVRNVYPRSMYHGACASEREVKVIPPLRVLEAHPVNEPPLAGQHSSMSLVSRGTVVIDSYGNIQNSRSRSSSSSPRAGVEKSDHHIQHGASQKWSSNPNDSAHKVSRPSGSKDGTSQERIRRADVGRKPSGTQSQSSVDNARVSWQDVDRTGSSTTKVAGRYNRGPRVSQRSSVNSNKRIRR